MTEESGNANAFTEWCHIVSKGTLQSAKGAHLYFKGPGLTVHKKDHATCYSARDSANVRI